MSADKRSLRAEMRLAAASHATDYVDCSAAWARVEESPEFIEASTVLVYMAMPGEVPTSLFIDKWLGRKRFVLPRVVGDSLELREYSPSALASGYLGILEPSASAALVDPCSVDLAIVPGVAFDRAGGRLGHGKGFYDRLLPQLHCPLFGICFQWRVVESVPVDANDVRMDKVFF